MEFKYFFFKEAFEIAKQAGSYLPYKVIGWDISITSNGSVFLEGNKNPSLIMTDITNSDFLKYLENKEVLDITS